MALAYFRPGANVVLDGHEYRLQKMLEDGTWVMENQNTGRVLERHTQLLHGDYADGSLVFKTWSIVGINGKERPLPVTAELTSEKRLNEGTYRTRYVKAVLGHPLTRSVLEPLIRNEWERSGVPEVIPYWSTVIRWVNSYVASGGSGVGLSPNYAGRGNRTARVHPDVVACCEWVIDNFYLTLGRPTIEDALNFAAGEIAAVNRLLPKSQHLQAPSRKLFRRLLALVPSYDADVARYGREAARRKYRTSLKIRLTEGPLQRAEMDHTRLDVMLVDEETGAPLGRPWLTILIDDFTRCILGYALTFEPPSRASITKCLRHAFLPKAIRNVFPSITNEWVAWGVPGELAFDNGLEFHAIEVRQVCHELSVDVNYAPRKTPWFKGKVERVIRTLLQGAVSHMPGKTFSNIFEKADYDPKLHAVLPYRLVNEAIVAWICDVYSVRPHRALGRSPKEMWDKHIKEYQIGWLPDLNRFDAILGLREEFTLTHAGISRLGLTYNSAEMGQLRQQFGTKLLVDVRVNQADLGSILVLHPRSKEAIKVPCLNPEYANGLSDWQHKVCRAFVKKQKTDGADGDIAQWKQAFHRIAKMVKEHTNQPKRKLSTSTAVGRWLENSQAWAQHTARLTGQPEQLAGQGLPPEVGIEPPSIPPTDMSPSSSAPLVTGAAPPAAEPLPQGTATEWNPPGVTASAMEAYSGPVTAPVRASGHALARPSSSRAAPAPGQERAEDALPSFTPIID